VKTKKAQKPIFVKLSFFLALLVTDDLFSAPPTKRPTAHYLAYKGPTENVRLHNARTDNAAPDQT